MDYWYALHSKWRNAMKGAKVAYFVLGCIDLPFAFAIPYDKVEAWIPKLNKSEPPGRDPYWHIKLKEVAGQFSLKLSGTGNVTSVEEYRLGLG